MFTYQKTITRISIAISILAAFATLSAFFWSHPGSGYEFTTLRGEVVHIVGSGLYRYETLSFYAQAIAQDVITLIVAVPLLLISLLHARRGSMRARVVLAGLLAYFLYTYASYAFLSAFNELYLVYVALFSLSLSGVILSFMSLNPEEVMAHISARYPRRGLGIFSILAAFLIAMMWMGRILPAIFGQSTPVGLEAGSTLVIQSLDLGLVVPLGFLSGILLLKKQPWGYLLGSIFLFKATTLAMAVFVMAMNMLRMGVADTSLVETSIFGIITALAVYFSIRVVKQIQ